jgi:hypothetical protein
LVDGASLRRRGYAADRSGLVSGLTVQTQTPEARIRMAPRLSEPRTFHEPRRPPTRLVIGITPMVAVR